MATQRTYKQVVGDNVRDARTSAGMTQQQLGEAVKQYLGYPWPKQIVSAIEQGRRPVDTEELLAIALLLDVRVPDLLTPDDSTTKVRIEYRDKEAGRVRLATHIDTATVIRAVGQMPGGVEVGSILDNFATEIETLRKRLYAVTGDVTDAPVHATLRREQR